MTAPQMFTFGIFLHLRCRGKWRLCERYRQWSDLPINPYQFSLNGEIYIINTNVQPNTVIGGGSTVTMTANNTQFVLDGAQYTITLKAGSLTGRLSPGSSTSIRQCHRDENYIYLLDRTNARSS